VSFGVACEWCLGSVIGVVPAEGMWCPLRHFLFPHRGAFFAHTTYEGETHMATTKDRTRTPGWLGRDRWGRIQITVGAGALELVESDAYERTALQYIERDRQRKPTSKHCSFCGGTVVSRLGDVSCEDCGRTPGTPVRITLARVIIPTLLRCESLVVDNVDRDEDGNYTVAFHLGDEITPESSSLVETSEQWALWTKIAGVTL
jgi:hypothetical protein